MPCFPDRVIWGAQEHKKIHHVLGKKKEEQRANVRAFPPTAGEDLWAWAGEEMKNRSIPLGHVDQCSSSNVFSAPGWALLHIPWLPFRNIIPLCHHALGTHSPTTLTSLPHLALCGSPSTVQLTSGLRSSREQCPAAPGWEFQEELFIFQYAWRSFSGYPFISVEKLNGTLDLSVTKPAPGPSPTHYTFGIISCSGANHTETLEELGSCGHLHNAWCASSSIVLLSSLTTIERISGFNFFPPFPLFTWSY